MSISSIETQPTAAPSILLLEDNEALMAVLTDLLRSALPGCVLLTASSIAQAHARLAEAAPGIPGLFVLDINLPDGTGLDFLCDVRTTHPDARALVMTAAPLPSYRDRARRLGVLHFLEKPFSLDTFIATVRALLDPARAPEPALFAPTLREFDLPDLVQIRCLAGATSVLECRSPRGDERGAIYFRRGRIVHASLRPTASRSSSHGRAEEAGATSATETEGREAFRRMVRWKGGAFSETPAPPGQVRGSIYRDWQLLLQEAAEDAAEEGGENAVAPSAPGGSSTGSR